MYKASQVRWKYFFEDLDTLGTPALGIEIKQRLVNFLGLSISIKGRGKKSIENIKDGILLVLKLARYEGEIAAFAANIQAPKWTTSEPECLPDDVERGC